MAELVNVCSFILCEKSQCCENWLIRCFLGFSCLNLRLFDLVIFNLVVILKHIHPLVCLHCHGSVHSQRVITAQPDFTLYRESFNNGGNEWYEFKLSMVLSQTRISVPPPPPSSEILQKNRKKMEKVRLE